jgi:hypothetical protein
LSTLHRIKKYLSSFLNAFEEAVILGVSSSGLFIRMVTEDLLPVCTFDLLFCSLPAVLGKSEDSIMVLALK